MIVVEGPDPGVLNRRMRHHAEQYRPLIDALIYSMLLESSLGRDDGRKHRLVQSRTGPGSFGLYLANGREYHFRPNGMQTPGLYVKDAYKNGKVLRTLKTPAEARQFMRKL